jgi:hypothetical protein
VPNGTIEQEAIERREGHRTLSLQVEEVRSDVVAVKAEVAKMAKGLRILRRKTAKNVEALTEELAKLNRRALAIALAAVLAAVGSIPEARALAVAIAKGLMHG